MIAKERVNEKMLLQGKMIKKMASHVFTSFPIYRELMEKYGLGDHDRHQKRKASGSDVEYKFNRIHLFETKKNMIRKKKEDAN